MALENRGVLGPEMPSPLGKLRRTMKPKRRNVLLQYIWAVILPRRSYCSRLSGSSWRSSSGYRNDISLGGPPSTRPGLTMNSRPSVGLALFALRAVLMNNGYPNTWCCLLVQTSLMLKRTSTGFGSQLRYSAPSRSSSCIGFIIVHAFMRRLEREFGANARTSSHSSLSANTESDNLDLSRTSKAFIAVNDELM